MRSGDLGGDLLHLLGEELKQPLMNIALLSELGGKDHMIRVQAQRALNTIDNVLLYRKLASGQMQLQLEPVHVGSAIAEVAEAVEPQMKMAGCFAEVDIQSALLPADIDRRLLTSALLSLWQAFITATNGSSEIVCNAQKIQSGIRLTLTSDGVNMDELTLAGTNITSTQPVSGMAGPAADLITASSMFRLAGTKLTKTRRQDARGFGVTLPVSKQIQLV